MFSPHTWGWSARGGCAVAEIAVFPTPVGMVRRLCRQSPVSSSFPHTRGDGPDKEALIAEMEEFSPHPWGWSGVGKARRHGNVVFPTPVGMVRRCGKARACTCSFPHTRGDGPSAGMTRNVASRFSPHPWGWSVVQLRVRVHYLVFPTSVGMLIEHPLEDGSSRAG